jgi:hypothetical protein
MAGFGLPLRQLEIKDGRTEKPRRCRRGFFAGVGAWISSPLVLSSSPTRSYSHHLGPVPRYRHTDWGVFTHQWYPDDTADGGRVDTNHRTWITLERLF